MRNFIEAAEVVTLAMYKQRHPELADKAERARNNLYLHEDTKEDDIIVIEVENYPCVALLKRTVSFAINANEKILEIEKQLAPFDSKTIYPRQALTTEYKFMRY